MQETIHASFQINSKNMQPYLQNAYGHRRYFCIGGRHTNPLGIFFVFGILFLKSRRKIILLNVLNNFVQWTKPGQQLCPMNETRSTSSTFVPHFTDWIEFWTLFRIFFLNTFFFSNTLRKYWENISNFKNRKCRFAPHFRIGGRHMNPLGIFLYLASFFRNRAKKSYY